LQNSDNKQTPRPMQGGVFTVGSSLLLLAGIALGLLLMVIGAATRSRGVVLTGAFIFPLSLFTGGLFWSEEFLPVRITLISLGGLFVIAAVARLFAV
jgi:hypothetical protein